MTPTELGALLRTQRLAQGVSQEHLAARIGVSRQTVIALEAGRVVQGTTLLAVLAAIGLTIAPDPRAERGISPVPPLRGDRPTIKDLLRRRRQEAACDA